jgi:hypothetical protein
MNPDDKIPRREWTDFLEPQPEVVTWDGFTLVLGRTEDGVVAALELYTEQDRLILSGVRHAQTDWFTVSDLRPSLYDAPPDLKYSMKPKRWLWYTWDEVARGLQQAIDMERRDERVRRETT